MTHAAITGWGKCMPPAVLTNQDLATFLETNNEWITTRTGIAERRVAHVQPSEMAYVAGARALACADLSVDKLDLIVYGSCTNDEQVPNSASGVQLRLGAVNAAAMDVDTACTSFLYALSTATAMIRTGVVANALVIGVEAITPYMDWDNRNARCTQNVIVRSKTGIFLEASVHAPPCSVDRNIIWGSDRAIVEYDSCGHTFAHNVIGASKTGILLRGKHSDRNVNGKSTSGGNHTVVNNAFASVEKTIDVSRPEEFSAEPRNNQRPLQPTISPRHSPPQNPDPQGFRRTTH